MKIWTTPKINVSDLPSQNLSMNDTLISETSCF